MFSLLLLFFSIFNSLLIFGFSISFNYLPVSSFLPLFLRFILFLMYVFPLSPRPAVVSGFSFP